MQHVTFSSANQLADVKNKKA